jgi:hypothetical protein
MIPGRNLPSRVAAPVFHAPEAAGGSGADASARLGHSAGERRGPTPFKAHVFNMFSDSVHRTYSLMRGTRDQEEEQ